MPSQNSLVYSLTLAEATLLIVIPPSDESRQLVHITDHPDGDALYERLTDGSFVRVGGSGTIGGAGTLNQIPKFTPDGTHIGNSQIFDNGTSVGINTITPSAKARLEIVSTTQGILFPKLTTLQRNAIAPAAGDAGLWVYNTSTSLYNYWDGAAWQEVDSNATSEWLLDGNTNAAERYIGTNNAFDFPIYTNGAEVSRYGTDGSLMLGTPVTNSSSILTIDSTTRGILFPRMTTVQRDAIVLPAEGLIIFNTDTETIDYFDGVMWNSIPTMTSAWVVDGNTNGVERSIGTNDAFDFPVETNGVEVARFYVGGNIGAGNNAGGALDGSLTIGYNSGDLVDVHNTLIGINVATGIAVGAQNNTGLGFNAIQDLTTGTGNTSVGVSSGMNITTGFDNTSLGRGSLQTLVSGFNNTSLGVSSLSSLSGAGQNNTAIGFASMQMFDNAGDISDAFGSKALTSLTAGNGNVAVGYQSLTIVVTGINNTAVGQNAGGGLNANSSGNTMVGYYAGDGGAGHTSSQNTVIGASAGQGLTGSGNIILGYQSNATILAAMNNKLWIDVGNNAVPLIQGDFITNEIAFKGSIATADPLSGAGEWKLGTVVAGAVALDAANYVEVDIDGTIVKLLIAA